MTSSNHHQQHSRSRIIGIHDLRQHLATHLAAVREGEVITVIDGRGGQKLALLMAHPDDTERRPAAS